MLTFKMMQRKYKLIIANYQLNAVTFSHFSLQYLVKAKSTTFNLSSGFTSIEN